MNLKLVVSFLLFFIVPSCASPSTYYDDEIEAADIIKKLKKGENILINDVTINGDLDLTTIQPGYPESKGVIRYNISSSLAFLNCNFTGKIIGYRNDGKFAHVVICEKNLTFLNCEFQDEVIFKEAIIQGVVNFGNSKFNHQAIFTGASFNARYNYFNESFFKDKAYFQGILCNGSINFMKAEFVGIGYFQNAAFASMAQFSNVKFFQNTDFSLVSFKGGCMFNYALFSGKAIFSSSSINQRGDFIEVHFKGETNFKRARIDCELKFTNSVFSNDLIFNDARFIFFKPDTEQTIFENDAKIEMVNARIIEGEELKVK
ncbi:MAG: hypothetical protein JXB49_27660 [Bacteroidales bacterium]|nr:hypothetical protein [Bacteroidales bacterium]